MGGLAEKMIQGSLKALNERDLAHVNEIMSFEDSTLR